MAAAAAPNGNSNGNGNHHGLQEGDGELNPEDQLQINDIDRVLERSLIRRIRVLDDTIRRLERLFRFTQANNPGPGALLRINRANARTSTLYAQLHTYIRRRSRQDQQQQVRAPPPAGNIVSNGNGANNNNAATGAPAADAWPFDAMP